MQLVNLIIVNVFVKSVAVDLGHCLRFRLTHIDLESYLCFICICGFWISKSFIDHSLNLIRLKIICVLISSILMMLGLYSNAMVNLIFHNCLF